MDKRIAFYTRKVAAWGDRSKRRNQYRYDRLMKYKKLLHERIGVN